MPQDHLTISIDSDLETRKGVHSDAVTIALKDGIARIDFLLADITNPDGSVRGLLSSRVFMNEGDLVLLRQAIDDALSNQPGANTDER